MIQYYDRKEKKMKVEKVAAGKYINWIYSSSVGMHFLEKVIKKKWLSSLYGKYCNISRSKRMIEKFVRDFEIDMNEYEKDVSQYKNFNDFFIRKVKKSARSISLDSKNLISCGDGRILVYENIKKDQLVQVKDSFYSLKELLDNEQLAQQYDGGTYCILRLAPVDYHRFHFIDDGICEETKKINGYYYSVNPSALHKIPKVFCQNKREISIFRSNNFGRLIYIEVGATFVGSIIQTFIPFSSVKKGQEKGYFKFGGSTVILLFEKGKVKIDEDILQNSKGNIETKVYMGEKIGEKYF